MSPRLRLVVLSLAVVASPAYAASFGPVVALTDVDPALHPWLPECQLSACPQIAAFGALPSRLTPFGDRLWFVADDGSHGAEPWVSDGSAEGTGMLLDLCPGDCSSLPQPLGVVAERVVFFASTPEDGVEPWVSDGTAAGSHRLADLCPGTCDAAELLSPWWDDAFDLTALDGALAGSELFFAARDGDGPGLFATDGASVRRVTSTPAAPRWLTAAGPGVAFLVGNDRLWWSDGSAAGTVAGPRHCPPERSVEIARPPVAFGDGVVYVAACGGPLGSSVQEYSLWRADADGSLTLLRLTDRPPSALVVDGGRIYATYAERLGAQAPDGSALWVSDGTPGGTVRSARLGLALVTDLVVFRDRLYAGGVRGGVPDPAEIALFEQPLSGGDGRFLGDLPLVPGSLAAHGGRLLWWQSPSADDDVYDLRLTVYEGFAEAREVQRFITPKLGPGGAIRERLRPTLAPLGDHLLLSADGGDGQQLWRLDGEDTLPDCAGDNTGDPSGDPSVLCLRDGRFIVRARFTNQHGGGAVGTATVDAASRQLGGDSGYFWFFRPDNLELAVKVLDGRGVNAHFWLFAGGTTDLGYEVEVIDRESGMRRLYHHPPGDLCSRVDTRAFAAPAPAFTPVVAGAVTTAGDGVEPFSCGPPGGPVACIGPGARFAVSVEYLNQHAGGALGIGIPTAYTADTATVRFFPNAGTELLVKVLDGRPVNGHFWVLWGGLTDLGTTLRVHDLEEDVVRTYVSAPGSLCGGADTTAF